MEIESDAKRCPNVIKPPLDTILNSPRVKALGRKNQQASA